MQKQVFLKGGGELVLFLFDFFFDGLSFLHLEITLLSDKLCYAVEEKP